jgi:hypothetical protein
MLQSDGEPTWQGKTYNALKDKKHLTGINKEGSLRSTQALGIWKGLTMNPFYYISAGRIKRLLHR